MPLFAKARSFLRNLFSSRGVDRDLDEEVRAHLDLLIEQNLRAGLPRAEAERAARLELGGIEQVKEQVRDQRLGSWLHSILSDCRYGLRQLRKNPGFTAAAVLTLALGIGANTVIFSVVSAVLLRPLPFPEPQKLVRVVSVRLRENAPDNASYPDFTDFRQQSHSFSQMAAFHTDRFTLTGHGEATHVQGAVVSADLFPLLGIRPFVGRAFLPEEDRPRAVTAVFSVILSHSLWRTRFGSDPAIVGKTIDLDNLSFVVVGVMPAGFQFPIQADPVDFWTTIAVDAVALPGEKPMTAQRGAHYLDVIARLKPEATPTQAQAELTTIVSALNQQYPENAPRTIWIVPELDQLVGSVRPALMLLLGAVGCVLLIACANLGNLLLSRGTSREKEIAVRGALGASRRRVIRQLLTENLLLAFLGGALGIALARWGIAPLVRLVPEDVPRLTDVHLDYTALLFTAALSLLTGVLFGLAPALQVSNGNFWESLRESGRGSSEGQRRTRLRSWLVAGDVAVATVLLVAAGLLIQSFLRLQRVELGYHPRGVLTFKVDLPFARYPVDHQPAFFQQSLARLNALPGVHSASAVLPLPLDGDDIDTVFAIEGQPLAEGHQPRTAYSWVEPAYFETLGINLKEGRDFTVRDDLNALPVVIVNETIARQYFPGQSPLGKRIRPQIGNGYQGAPMRQIVGVVADVRQRGLTSAPGPQVYVPRSQSPIGSMIFVVRTTVVPSSIADAARIEMQHVDPDLPIFRVKTLDQYFDQSVAQPHFLSVLLGIFAALAVLLAAVGIYGVISYSASQRTHEMGVRMALGADRRDVLLLVVGHGFRLALIGAAAGIIVSLLLTRFLSSLLYQVAPTDPFTFVAVLLLLGTVAFLACYIPARRATKVDPLVALRYE